MQCILKKDNHMDNIKFDENNTFKTYLTNISGTWKYNDNILKLFFDNNVYELYYNYNDSFKNIKTCISVIFNDNNLHYFFNKKYDNIAINGNKPKNYFISKFNRF